MLELQSLFSGPFACLCPALICSPALIFLMS